MSTTPPLMLRARPYRDFLTPAWHSKFTNAATLTYGACIALAMFSVPRTTGGWTWLIFRLTIQAFMLFLVALLVFVLRVAATTVGSRASASAFKSLTSNLFSFANIQVIFWYFFSAFLYMEIFTWAADSAVNVHMTRKTSYGYQLNERAILFRLSMLVTAGVQAGWHLYTDKSKVPIEIPTKASDENTQTGNGMWAALFQLRDHTPHFGIEIVEKVFISFMLCIVSYYSLLRGPLWEMNFTIFSTLGQLDRYSKTGSIAPAMSLFINMFFQSLFLIALWDFSNLTYDVLVAQEPLKLGAPLTDGSKDPNGTLITGLRAKKEFARANAFWELLIIVTRFPARRATIFVDVERQPAATWTQISQLCLAEIQGITNRIQAVSAPPPTPAVTTPAAAEPISRQSIAQPLKQASEIFAQTPPPQGLVKVSGSMVGKVGKSIGNSPGQGYQPVMQIASYGLSKVPDSVLDALEPNNIKSQANSTLITFMNIPYIGSFFRQTFARRATSVVCGAPLSHTITIVAAIRSLSLLVVHSLKEDKFGEVQKDVASIVRIFSATLANVENYLARARAQPHWSDVEFSRNSPVEEVDAVVEALRDGLRAIIGGFGEYAGTVGLTPADLSQAKGLIEPETSERKASFRS